MGVKVDRGALPDMRPLSHLISANRIHEREKNEKEEEERGSSWQRLILEINVVRY